MKRQRTGVALLGVAFLSFVMLGLPDGMLGVAWPSISREFDLPLGSLGVLLFGFTVGYVATTSTVGVLIKRLRYGALFVAAAGSMAAGGVTIVLTTWWWLLIAGAGLMGAGAGMLDGGLNAYGATHFRPRDLNWLHAMYGLGAATGPTIMTPLVVGGAGWRWGYAAFSLLAGAIAVLFVYVRRSWNLPNQETMELHEPDATLGDHRDLPVARRRVVVGTSVALFFLYTGLEVVAGQWAYSLFSIGRGVPEATSGTWVALYWGALTVGRVVFGWVAERKAPLQILRLVIAGAIGSTVLIVIGRPIVLGAAGLVGLGFCLAPMFPLLVAETPRRVGPRAADHVIGMQIAAANVGSVTLVAVVGFGVERLGLGVVPFALLIAGIAFTALHELVVYLSRPIRQRSQ
jgi:fucose permease